MPDTHNKQDRSYANYLLSKVTEKLRSSSIVRFHGICTGVVISHEFPRKLPFFIRAGYNER